MLFGAVLRPTGYNATLVSLDSSAAEKLSGVQARPRRRFRRGGRARRFHRRASAVSLLRAKWNVPAQPSNGELFKILKDSSDPGDGPQSVAGSVEQALAGAPIRVDQQYTVQYIAHAPLEPRAAVAEWNERQPHRLDGNAAAIWRS